jgi:replication-associated recombination protein RarA
MELFASQQGDLSYPQPLAEKYRPRAIADFIGLEKERKVASAFCRTPRESAFLFVGPSGVGKTTLALAMAQEMGAELHLIPSQKCTVQNLEDTLRQCAYVPFSGGFHFVLVEIELLAA